jgi:hypothetical protein
VSPNWKRLPRTLQTNANSFDGLKEKASDMNCRNFERSKLGSPQKKRAVHSGRSSQSSLGMDGSREMKIDSVQTLKSFDLGARTPVPFVTVSPCRGLSAPMGAATLTCSALWPSSCIGID